LQIVDLSTGLLKNNLVGIYLHGSLAMGCFNPTQSDIDLLIVVKESLSEQEKLALAKAYLTISNDFSPLELSIMTEYQTQNWNHPSRFEFHFSEEWRAKYKEAIDSRTMSILKIPEVDIDLAAHITILRERGITVIGKPIIDVFQTIPVSDYIAALMEDYGWAKQRLKEKPVYFILNACRLHAFLSEKQILSKAEGGTWALRTYPEKYFPIIEKALTGYSSNEEIAFNKIGINDFVNFTDLAISKLNI